MTSAEVAIICPATWSIWAGFEICDVLDVFVTSCCFLKSTSVPHDIHPWDQTSIFTGPTYIDLHENPKNQAKVGKYTIYGSYGVQILSLRILMNMVHYRSENIKHSRASEHSRGTVKHGEHIPRCSMYGLFTYIR